MQKRLFVLLVTLAGLLFSSGLHIVHAQNYSVAFYGSTLNFSADTGINVRTPMEASAQSVKEFYQTLNSAKYQPLLESLQNFRSSKHLDDWLYYQLIRNTAENLAPKQENYARYTLFKWFLMVKSGFDARLAVGNKQLIFYIKSDEDIADIPFFQIDGQQYICLNYHDYGKLFEKKDTYRPVKIDVDGAVRSFSYKVTKMPEFGAENYFEKELSFNYKQKSYHFNVKVTNEVASIFRNYPIVDFETYFNIPLSKITHESLIPLLKAHTKNMSIKNGVDYLMRFTRYAFLYEDDEQTWGKEKRNAPEQTLLQNRSDCDDRAALFFYLVREIYNLPMIAVLYPSHLTVAVQFEKPLGDQIHYEGKTYTVCEPTPQGKDLKIGEISSNLKNTKFEVVYAYRP